MYGETDAMRRRVRALREQGTDVRMLADQLVAQTDAVGWSGRAAAALRERIRDRAAHLRRVASRHDAAADSLERHLHEVDRIKESIAAVERRTRDLVAEARTRAARLETVPDDDAGSGVRLELAAADRALLDLDPPPPGHRDWLGVSVPGMSAR
ncbi:hypothetical protein [Nocardioides pantholopis]|uniref:hypothetical protein n=1 Tax=Nocardioides pantholopis TaxID=2483798 RepID=UPI000F0941AF|nr:hypothetical protein [Nocardioides pantholopis]